jgi:hypothetical protein
VRTGLRLAGGPLECDPQLLHAAAKSIRMELEDPGSYHDHVAAERLQLGDSLITADHVDRSESKRFRDGDGGASDAGFPAIWMTHDPGGNFTMSVSSRYAVGGLTPNIANWLTSPGGNGRRHGASVLMRSAQAGWRNGTNVRSPSLRCLMPEPRDDAAGPFSAP